MTTKIIYMHMNLLMEIGLPSGLQNYGVPGNKIISKINYFILLDPNRLGLLHPAAVQ
jgi:hypothetical protein